jgi:gluconolactonase
MQPDLQILATGLQFPEGPIAMPDGSILLVEIERGTLSRVSNGQIDVVAQLGGGPNGAAIGPDGACYICNNGGFEWIKVGDKTYPGEQPSNYSGGRIERVDLVSGAVQTLYSECDGQPLRGPNDIVFDCTGGFWFTDHGKTRPRDRDRTGVFYAQPDGSSITEVIFQMEAPNGIGLSADERTVFVAETPTGRVWAYDLAGPGQLAKANNAKRLLTGRDGHFMFDSLAIDANGDVCVATLLDGGITTLSDNGVAPKFVAMPDRITTNICFGGKGLKTAYITLSSTGQLVAMDWPVGGLPLNFLNR